MTDAALDRVITPEAAAEVVLSDQIEERRREAEVNRARFAAFVRGGLQRADALVTPGGTEKLAAGVVDLMLLRIIRGQVKPKSAKEAMDVATQAHAMMRREAGEPDKTIVIQTGEQRAAAIKTLGELRDAALKRQAIEAGLRADQEPIDVESTVVDPDIIAGSAAGSVPRSVVGGRALSTMRAMTDQEG